MYYIGLDIHKRNTQACVKEENGKVIVNERFPSDVKAIDAFLDRFPTEAKVVMEATGFYGYLYDAIEARGLDFVLAHPLKLKALTTGRAKTDRNDAEMLAELLRIDAVPSSHVPPKWIRELRELTRHRSSLVVESTSLKNRIRAELAMHGIRPPTEARSPFTKRFIVWLRSLRRPTIDDLLDILDLVRRMIRDVERRIEEATRDDEDVQLLRMIPGVGPVIATGIKAEVGEIERFRSTDGLASYAGVVPVTRQSREKVAHCGHMSKRGNRRLRHMLAEAVHVHVMSCPDSRLTRFYLRKREVKGSKKATVATARKMLEVMYLMIIRKEEFTLIDSTAWFLRRRGTLLSDRGMSVRKDGGSVIMRLGTLIGVRPSAVIARVSEGRES